MRIPVATITEEFAADIGFELSVAPYTSSTTKPVGRCPGACPLACIDPAKAVSATRAGALNAEHGQVPNQALPEVGVDGWIDVPASNHAQQRGPHGLFRFFGKLAPDVTAAVLDLAASQLPEIRTPVVDVMCGSGQPLSNPPSGAGHRLVSIATPLRCCTRTARRRASIPTRFTPLCTRFWSGVLTRDLLRLSAVSNERATRSGGLARPVGEPLPVWRSQSSDCQRHARSAFCSRCCYREPGASQWRVAGPAVSSSTQPQQQRTLWRTSGPRLSEQRSVPNVTCPRRWPKVTRANRLSRLLVPNSCSVIPRTLAFIASLQMSCVSN